MARQALTVTEGLTAPARFLGGRAGHLLLLRDQAFRAANCDCSANCPVCLHIATILTTAEFPFFPGFCDNPAGFGQESLPTIEFPGTRLRLSTGSQGNP